MLNEYRKKTVPFGIEGEIALYIGESKKKDCLKGMESLGLGLVGTLSYFFQDCLLRAQTRVN